MRKGIGIYALLSSTGLMLLLWGLFSDIKTLLPGLSIVFGSGAGMLASTLYSFHLVIGIIGGAAAGLLIGFIAPMLFSK